MSNNSAFFAGSASLDEYPNTYLTVADETIAAGTQVIYEDYLELAASFVFELAVDAILVVGDFSAPLTPPDENPNRYVTVTNEEIPPSSEINFSDLLELSAPFVSELDIDAILQLGDDSRAQNFQLLFSQTLGTSATGIDTGSNGLSTAFTHLLFIALLRSDSAGATQDTARFQFNGDTGSNYTYMNLSGNASAASSGTSAGQTSLQGPNIAGNTNNAGVFGNVIGLVPFYTNQLPKTVLMWGGDVSSSATNLGIFGGLWTRGDQFINQMKSTPQTGTNFVAGSALAIYGIR